MNDPHSPVPDNLLITAYGDGGFSVSGKRYHGSAILTPEGLYPWPVTSIEEVTPGVIGDLIARLATTEILLIGTGATLARPTQDVLSALDRAGRPADYMDTGAACRTYNALLSDGRLVAAALIAV